MKHRVKSYFSTLLRAQEESVVTCANGVPLSLDRFFETAIEWARRVHATGGKVMFIGNGGSATIASHMAIDFTKNGGIRSLAFNDSAALTCLGNDLGYENVFAKQIEMLATSKDLLVAISSSGSSPNILNGVRAARTAGCEVITMS
ncbi:MAG: SIS domain-containing protein, partial [Proteobacteria bacterium]|nr:SIS domain-containing protein [Pseudomonadota bacterium]